MTAFSCVVVALVLSSWTVDAFAPANPTQRHNSATMLDTIQFQAVSAQSTDIVKCNKPPSLFTFQSTAMINAALVGFGLAFCAASPAWADGQTKDFKFPPVDNSDENRCVLKSSSMGQANAARDALFDLRQCKLSNVNAVGYDLSGAGKGFVGCCCFCCDTIKLIDLSFVFGWNMMKCFDTILEFV